LRTLLAFSRLVDAITDRFGWLSDYLVIGAVLISAGNAGVRYLFGYSSNGLLEIQWYMFGAVVMLGASQTLRTNEHVRVDVLYSVIGDRGRLIVDLLGLLLFLLPAMAFLAWLSWPVFLNSYRSGELSNNYGGLIRWPIMLVIPVGFALLVLQGISEVIKRLAALHHDINLDTHYEKPLQ
jgi:TRAP-type mannitol/chloroaromatic compound transport system permease small subunit